MSDVLVAASSIVPPAIYDSPEAFSDYLESVRTRREMRRTQLRTHWQNALDSLLPELEAAKSEFDTELAAELNEVVARFRTLLERFTLPQDAQLVTVNIPAAESLNLNAHFDKVPLFSVSDFTDITLEAVVASEILPSVEIHGVSETLLSEVEIPTENAEAIESLDAIRAEVSTLIEKVRENWNMLDRDGLLNKDGSLNRSHCFSLRALICRLAAARVLAAQNELEHEYAKLLGGLRDTLCTRRQMDKDRSDSFVCSDNTWRCAESIFSANAWCILADDFERLAVAQSVIEWFHDQQGQLGETHQQGLLNGIGAACTLVGETLSKVEGKDKLHLGLVGLLHQYSDRFYLAGIAPGTTNDVLEQYADSLPTLWQSAKDSLAHKEEIVSKEARKVHALNAVIALCQEPEFGKGNSRVDADRPRLLPLLDECKKAGVPPSNPQLREALMDCAYYLLSGQSGYLTFLNEVTKEKSRRAEEQKIEEESGDKDVDDPEFSRLIAAVSPYVEGKSLLILGGDRKTQHVEEELTRILPFASVQWDTIRKTANANKHEASIRKSDITCLIVNFMSHDLNGKGKKWAEDAGKIAVNVVKGYGPRRIVQSLYERFYGNGS